MRCTFSLKRTFAYLVIHSARIWTKPTKAEIQVIFVLPGTRRVSGLWYTTSLIPTQRAIRAFAAKVHSEHEVLQLCIKTPNSGIPVQRDRSDTPEEWGQEGDSVYLWRNGQLTTNWNLLTKR